MKLYDLFNDSNQRLHELRVVVVLGGRLVGGKKDRV